VDFWTGRPMVKGVLVPSQVLQRLLQRSGAL
jgi:hypothetical protein